MTGLKQVALSGARWTLASRLGLQLVTWPITIVVMRLLEPADYGLFAIALIVHAFITMFGELGLGVALVQIPTATPAQTRMAASLVLALSAVMTGVIFVIAPWVGQQYDQPQVAAVMRVLAAELLITACAAVPLALLERALRYRAISQGQIAGGVAGALITLGAAVAGAGVWALVAGNLANAAVRSMAWIVAHGRPVLPGRVDLAGVRPMAKVGGHTLAARLLWFWSYQADNLVLGLLLPASALGAYSVASQLAMLPAGKAMESVNKVAFPLLCRAQDDAAATGMLVQRLRGLLALYGFGVCWALAAVAPEFVELILGGKWSSAVVPLALLALVSPLRMLSAFQNTVVTALNAPEAATREQLLAAVLIPLAVALGAMQHGLSGAAWAWLLAYPLLFGVSVALTSRVLRQRWGDAVAPMLAPAAAASIMLAAVWLVRWGVAGPWPVSARLALHIATAGLVYLGLLWVLVPLRLRETGTLVKELVRPAA